MKIFFWTGYLVLTLIQLCLGWVGWIWICNHLGFNGRSGGLLMTGGILLNLGCLWFQAYFWGFVAGPSLKRDIDSLEAGQTLVKDGRDRAD